MVRFGLLYSMNKPCDHLLSSLSKSTRLDDALHLLDQIPHRKNLIPLALKSNLLSNPIVAAALIRLNPTAAVQIFDSVPPDNRNESHALWTVLIDRHSRTGDHPAAIRCFRRMRSSGTPPNRFTLPALLSSCGSGRALSFGRQAHACAFRFGFAASRFVQSSLVGMYAKCDDLASARRVLDLAELDDQVSWNSLIVVSSRSGHYDHALSLFVEMRRRGLETDDYTYPSALNSFACKRDVNSGSAVHSLVVKTGFERYNHVGNALVDMYAKCGRVDCARSVFNGMSDRDVVSWTSLFVGYANHVSDEAALRLFIEMQADGVDVDDFVLAGVLSSCAGLTLLELGRQVHAVTVRRGFDSFRSVGNSLVSMYAKCGCVDDARMVFDLMDCRDAITWTALIVGYAQNGRGGDSLWLYEQMVQTGSRPDYVTFIGVLFACSHAGLVEVGRSHFYSMEAVYHITPGQEHYACMIDLLGRSGQIAEAKVLMSRMKTEPDATVWKALLAACRVHQELELAEQAAENLFRLEPMDAVPYILLSNMYSISRRWDDVARIRSLMKSRGVSKEPGCSWIEVEMIMHVFHVEDRGHPRSPEIYAKLDEMMGRIRVEGYVPDTGFSLHDGTEEGKEMGLAFHSEKLAVAFGLIGVPHTAAIRVFKNLRVCGDCHTALKLVSKVYGRRIVLRDSNCFHHLSQGSCSCGDYW